MKKTIFLLEKLSLKAKKRPSRAGNGPSPVGSYQVAKINFKMAKKFNQFDTELNKISLLLALF